MLLKNILIINLNNYINFFINRILFYTLLTILLHYNDHITIFFQSYYILSIVLYINKKMIYGLIYKL